MKDRSRVFECFFFRFFICIIVTELDGKIGRLYYSIKMVNILEIWPILTLKGLIHGLKIFARKSSNVVLDASKIDRGSSHRSWDRWEYYMPPSRQCDFQCACKSYTFESEAMFFPVNNKEQIQTRRVVNGQERTYKKRRPICKQENWAAHMTILGYWALVIRTPHRSSSLDATGGNVLEKF